jgi:hypothetical protein
MSEAGEMWSMIHDMRDRLARQEERSTARDTKIAAMDEKLDKIVDITAQARGAATFARWTWGVGGAISATVVANWHAVKRIF